MLIDVHGHFYGPRNNVPGGEALNQAYLDAARKAGISRIVGVVLGTWGDRSSTYAPSLEDMRYGNRFMLEIMRRHPGLVHGYAYVNPALEHHALEEMERCIQEGMVGLKLGAGARCTSPLVAPLIERCIHHDIPVLHHVLQRRQGEYPGVALSDAADLAGAAARFPEARFIQAHIGGGGDWAFGIRAAAANPNVYLDLAGSGCDAGMAEYALAVLGEDRLLFGTDLTLDTGLARLDTLRHLGADLEKVGGKNALRVFGGRLV